MKFKMRVVSHSPAELARVLGGAIAKNNKTTNDGIPPAYPIQNEKLLFIGVESKGRSFDTKLIDFCRDLTPERVLNVAFFVVNLKKTGPDLNILKDVIKKDGINVVEDVLEIDMHQGLFGKSAVSQKQLDSVVAWSEKVIDSLLDK